MRLLYPPGYKSKGYTLEEDIFLVCMMHKYGVGSDWLSIKDEIRKAWQFRFDWFFKSRTILELQKRGEFLTKLIEKENEEMGAKLKTEEAHLIKASTASKSKSSSSSSSKRQRPSSSSHGSSSKRKKK